MLNNRTKKIILWSSTLLVAAVLLFFWVKSVPGRLGDFQKKEFIEKLNFPNIEIPNINGQKASTTTE